MEKARVAIGRDLRVAPGSLSSSASVANSGFPQCAFGARVGGRGVVVVVEDDVEPDAYAVLERTIDEAAQIFPVRLSAAPMHVAHLGLDASWFPEEGHLETTDGVRLVIATVSWPRAPLGRRIALAVAAARTYLGRLEPKLARGPAP